MQDFSHLDQKYFLDETVYNCPFCNRKNIHYNIVGVFDFDWSESKKCYGFIARCSFCSNDSMHLSYKNIVPKNYHPYEIQDEYRKDIDSQIFYSVPTSFFVIDERAPKKIRELITEAEGCLKMNFLTGASACARKAIYELTVHEKCIGDSYEDKIKFLKKKYKDTDGTLFDILSHIQDMTSDKVHEQSWPKWEAKNLKLIIETLKTVLFDIYVLPQIKADRSHDVLQLLEDVKGKNGDVEKPKEEINDVA
jgi:hypothetical protein